MANFVFDNNICSNGNEAEFIYFDKASQKQYKAFYVGFLTFSVADANSPYATLAAIDPIDRLKNTTAAKLGDMIQPLLNLGLKELTAENDYTVENIESMIPSIEQGIKAKTNASITSRIGVEITDFKLSSLLINDAGSNETVYSYVGPQALDPAKQRVLIEYIQVSAWRKMRTENGQSDDVSLYTSNNPEESAKASAPAEMKTGNARIDSEVELLRKAAAYAEPASAQPVAPAPTPSGAWTCSCGNVCTGKFCPECGSPSPNWTCECGSVNTSGKFCPQCGKPRS